MTSASQGVEYTQWLRDATGSEKQPPKMTPGKGVNTWIIEVQAWTLYTTVEIHRQCAMVAAVSSFRKGMRAEDEEKTPGPGRRRRGNQGQDGAEPKTKAKAKAKG